MPVVMKATATCTPGRKAEVFAGCPPHRLWQDQNGPKSAQKNPHFRHREVVLGPKYNDLRRLIYPLVCNSKSRARAGGNSDAFIAIKLSIRHLMRIKRPYFTTILGYVPFRHPFGPFLFKTE
jgi:hypothetical protein